LHIFVVGGDRDFKFGRQVDSSKPTDDKTFLKGAWSGHVNRLNFGKHKPYLWKG